MLAMVLASCEDDSEQADGATAEGPGAMDLAGTPDVSVPGQDQCSLAAQTGCDEGSKCTLVTEDESRNGVAYAACVPVLGDGIAGDDCQRLSAERSADTCARGHWCLVTDQASLTGICAQICGPGDSCESMTEQCSRGDELSPPVCLLPCDPVVPECEQDFTCQPDAFELWFCRPPHVGDERRHGDPCGLEGDCAEGFVCWEAFLVDSPTCQASGSSSCCARLCDLDDTTTPCPGSAEQCLAFYARSEDAPPGLQDVGVCAVPQ
jgi:hypothetical protein